LQKQQYGLQWNQTECRGLTKCFKKVVICFIFNLNTSVSMGTMLLLLELYRGWVGTAHNDPEEGCQEVSSDKGLCREENEMDRGLQ